MKINFDEIRNTIIEKLAEADKYAYGHENSESRVYVDTDGVVDSEEWTAGDNGWFRFRDPEYDRFYIHTLCHQYYSILWDWWFDDRDKFAEAFRENFGVELADEYGNLEALGREACDDAGISGYDEWLEECKEEAIENAVSDALSNGYYDEICAEAERKYDEAHGDDSEI